MTNLSEKLYSRLEYPHSVTNLSETLGSLGMRIDWFIEVSCRNGVEGKEIIAVASREIGNSREANYRSIAKIFQIQGFCIWKGDINPDHYWDNLVIRKSSNFKVDFA